MTRLRPPVALEVETAENGSWRVIARPVGENPVDVTLFRGAPTQIDSLTWTDPFGPAAASLTFPSVTILDEAGTGDLWWLRPEIDIDVLWVNVDGETVTSWEGFLVGMDYTGASMKVSCKGAMTQMDNYLAIPEYLAQPLTYERAILRQFDGRPDLRLGPARIEWPEGWRSFYDSSMYDDKPWWLRPADVVDGDMWTDMLTRSTGNNERLLSEYIQGLLSNMFTETGQFTLMLDAGRVPVLRHRANVTSSQPGTLVLDVLQPGVEMTASRDFTQRINAVYGSGKTFDGIVFSGMQSSADGRRTWFEPWAARREVHPKQGNSWFDRRVMRREVNLSFSPGMTAEEAGHVARRHLQRNADPGLTGQITLTTNPIRDGQMYPRELVRAGMGVQLRGLFGRPEGVMVHLTEVSYSQESSTLVFDSKYRDQLSVQEVRLRGWDSMVPARMMSAQDNANTPYANGVGDLLMPWNDEQQSGYVPYGAKSVFDGMPDGTAFPWVSWTREHPPSANPDAYIRIGPARANASFNWANKVVEDGYSDDPYALPEFEAYSVHLSQAGEARLIQVAAYDIDGNLMPVEFHLSFYRVTPAPDFMPIIPTPQDPEDPSFDQEIEDSFDGYVSPMRYPFFKTAFTHYYDDGTQLNIQEAGVSAPEGMLAGWGNYYSRPGYWPDDGVVAEDPIPTGMFVSEGGLSWSLQGAANQVDPYLPPNQQALAAGDIWVMIYCDQQLDEDVFFLGRIFRSIPGVS